MKLELRASQSDQTDSLVGRLHLVVRSGKCAKYMNLHLASLI